ncbi:Retinal guanylyl cyclase 2 [Dissostichus eleginoides]|uniref:Retinal guanylyl cyclase 2 n=1 Tax=Dissostichus eleginoides TaxID=100907 RepID=A0AAD9BWB6_DISEL|nr:Retinal guanylyl cyclase 2 [Dissostichus eleginoides]
MQTQRRASIFSSPPDIDFHHLASVSSPLLPPFLLRFLLLLLCFLPCPLHASFFRVGILGPWGCDPLFAKALPNVAAQLAVNRINKDRSLSYAATFDFTVLQEPCETSKALEKFLGFHTKASAYIGPSNPGYCDAASMLSKGWNKVGVLEELKV